MSILDRNQALDAPDPARKDRYLLKVPFTTSLFEIVPETVTASYTKIPSKARFSAGSNNYYPDVHDIDAISVTFYETSDFIVTKWISYWRSLIVDADGNYGVPVDYKKDIELAILYIGSDSPVYTRKYIGCWPTDQSSDELSYDAAEEALTVTIQFSVDNVEMS